MFYWFIVINCFRQINGFAHIAAWIYVDLVCCMTLSGEPFSAFLLVVRKKKEKEKEYDTK